MFKIMARSLFTLPEKAMKKPDISAGKIIPALVAIFVSSLFCLNFYLFISSRKVKQENQNQQSVISTLQKEKEMLESQLSVKKEDIEYFRQQREVLDKMVEKQKIKPKKKKVAKDKDVRV